jgi:hypothetical protein
LASRDQYVNTDASWNINRGRLRGVGKGAKWVLEGKEADTWLETAQLPVSTSLALSTWGERFISSSLRS